MAAAEGTAAVGAPPPLPTRCGSCDNKYDAKNSMGLAGRSRTSSDIPVSVREIHTPRKTNKQSNEKEEEGKKASVGKWTIRVRKTG